MYVRFTSVSRQNISDDPTFSRKLLNVETEIAIGYQVLSNKKVFIKSFIKSFYPEKNFEIIKKMCDCFINEIEKKALVTLVRYNFIYKNSKVVQFQLDWTLLRLRPSPIVHNSKNNRCPSIISSIVIGNRRFT